MKKATGFTMIELLIVMVIIGILIAISMPSFMGYLLQSHRTDAHSSLLDIAARQERFIAQRVTAYSGTITDVGSATTADGYYDLGVAACTGGTLATCYLITATAVGGQLNDTGCGTITYDSRGTKSPAACW